MQYFNFKFLLIKDQAYIIEVFFAAILGSPKSNPDIFIDCSKVYPPLVRNLDETLISSDSGSPGFADIDIRTGLDKTTAE